MRWFKCKLSWDGQSQTYTAQVSNSDDKLTCGVTEALSYVGEQTTKLVDIQFLFGDGNEYLDNPTDIRSKVLL